MAMKDVLMIGGPADGQKFTLAARLRTFTYYERSTQGRAGGECFYAIGSLIGLHRAYSIGVRDLNVDAILALLTAYRRPFADDSDANEVANSITFLGGPADGMRVLRDTLEPGQDTITPPLRRASDGPVPEYRVVPLVAKDQQEYQVALIDPQTDCPIGIMIDGYRKPMPSPCRFCGALVEDACETPPPDTCEKGLTARRVRVS